MAIPFLKGIDVAGTVDLSNLTIDGAQGTDGQVLTSTGTGIAWEDASGGASLSGGAANKLAIWSSATALTNDTNLHWDTTNNRLGIGDSTPSYTLDVNGTIYGSAVRSGRYYGTSGTSSYLDLDSSAPYSLLASSEVNVTDTIICNDLEATETGGIVASNGPVFANRFYGNGSTTYFLDPNDVTTSAVLNGRVSIGTSDFSSTFGSAPNLRVASSGTGNPGVIDILRRDGAVTAGETTGILQFSVDDDNNYCNAQIEVESASTAGGGNSGGGILKFKTTPSSSGGTPVERLRIENTGNVGIGVEPTEKLHVNNGFLKVQPPEISGTTPPSITIRSLINQYQSGMESSGHLTMKSGATSNFYWYKGSTSIMYYTDALYVNKLVDKDSTSYYLDPASSSVALNINGKIAQAKEDWNIDGSHSNAIFQASRSNQTDRGTWPTTYMYAVNFGDRTKGIQLASRYDGSNDLYFRTGTDNSSSENGANTWKNWRQLYHVDYHPEADKWTTARTLTLNGDVSGSVSWDGSANATLTTAVANDSHDHTRITERSTITFGAGQLQWTDLNGTGGAGTNGNAPGNPFSDWHHHIIMNHANSGGYYVDLAFSFHSDRVHFRRLENGSFGSWREFFHTGHTPTAAEVGAAPSSHNHDDRYYTESEMQTFFKRGYISSHSSSSLAVGWYTIATNTGDRALGEFQIWDTTGGRHQSVLFNASHHYGTDNSNDLTVLANSRFSTDVFRYIRIKENSTYDGAVLQIYIDNTSNSVSAAITGANAQVSGWVLEDWLADATTPSSVSNYSSFTEKCRIDLDNTRDGGMETTGQFHAQNFIQSSYDSSKYARFESNSSGGVVKGVGGGGFLARSYGDTYFNGGNFGIGTSSPDTKLHVEGNLLVDAYAVGQDNGIFLREGYLSTDQPSITVWDMSNGGVSPDGLSINANDGIRFRENGGEVARFKDGSFGINVTNPSSILHVDEPSVNAASLTFGAAAGQIFQNENSEFAFGLHNASPYPLYIQGRTTSNTARNIALNPLGGQVNIGTLSNSTSSYKLNMGGSIDMNAYNIDYVSQLHFQDGVRFYDDGNDNYLNFKWNDTGGGGMRFRDGDSAIMGTVYGDGGDQFGLLDADGSWAVRIDKDVAVDLRVNNSSRLICDTGGVEFRNGGTYVGEVTTAGVARFADDVIAYYSFSDQRLKTDIKPTTNNLDKILKLEPVEYTWKDGGRKGRKEIGLIAQDVEKVIPEVVRENERLNDDTLYKQVDYEHVVSTLIGAIQEQQKQIDELKSIINGGS